MPLSSFGSIMTFAEEMEIQDAAFYRAAAASPCIEAFKEVFSGFEADGIKNRKAVVRARQENVTEMILEPIQGFARQPYQVSAIEVEGLAPQALVTAARGLEERAERFYLEAAAKLKALPEAARALKRMAKKRVAHLNRLNAIQ